MLLAAFVILRVECRRTWQRRGQECVQSASGLENLARVSHPLCDPFAVEIFEQRNRVFSAHSGQLFKSSDVNSGGLRALGGHLAPEFIQSCAVEDKVFGYFDEYPLPQKQGDNLVRACLVDFEPLKHILQSRYFQTSAVERR